MIHEQLGLRDKGISFWPTTYTHMHVCPTSCLLASKVSREELISSRTCPVSLANCWLVDRLSLCYALQQKPQEERWWHNLFTVILYTSKLRHLSSQVPTYLYTHTPYVYANFPKVYDTGKTFITLARHKLISHQSHD